MNHHVPDFNMEQDSGMPSSSSARYLHHKKSSRAEDDDFVELVWQNGQIVLQSQKSHKKSVKLPPNAILPGRLEPGAGDEIESSTTTATAQQLFLQEDEMAWWLHYPLVDEPFVDHREVFGGELLYPPASVPLVADGRPEDKPAQPPDPQPMAPPARGGYSSRPPLHPSRRTEEEKMVNFKHFSRGKEKMEYRPLDLERPGWESTVVESNETPAGVRVLKGERFIGGNAGSITCGGGDREVGSCEQTMTSSSGGSGASAERLAKRPPSENRKRKARQGEESECQSEDADYESIEEKKIARRFARRARAAEVHNLSERRRRDRINEKMKALQELIPRCNKSDKASMLDEAIEYLKSLQLQVQMMSMGCSMSPMMFPGVQQYLPPMGMGMSMVMEMATGGLGRPVIPFTPVLPGTTTPGPSGAHLAPRLPMPGFHLPLVSPFDLSRVQTASQHDSASNPAGLRSPHPLHSPNFADPYQHYLSLHHMQVQSQDQALAQPSTSKGAGTPPSHEAG